MPDETNKYLQNEIYYLTCLSDWPLCGCKKYERLVWVLIPPDRLELTLQSFEIYWHGAWHSAELTITIGYRKDKHMWSILNLL